MRRYLAVAISIREGQKKMIERKFVCQKHSHKFKKMVTEETINSGMTRCTHADKDLFNRECGSLAWLIKSKEEERLIKQPRIFKSFNINKAYEELLCEKRDLQAENRVLRESLKLALHRARIERKRVLELKESHAELLSALEVAAQEEDGYVFNDTIQKALAIKEKESK